MTEGSKVMRKMGGWDTCKWASCMCYRLMWEVEVAPRKQTRGDSLPLIPLPSGDVMSEYLGYILFVSSEFVWLTFFYAAQRITG